MRTATALRCRYCADTFTPEVDADGDPMYLDGDDNPWCGCDADPEHDPFDTADPDHAHDLLVDARAEL